MSIEKIFLTPVYYLIILLIVVAILIFYFTIKFIKKLIVKKKATSSEKKLLNKIRYLIRKRHLRDKICELHVFPGTLSNCIQVNNVTKDLDLEVLSEQLIFAIGKNCFFIVISDEYISEFDKIRKKKNIYFSNINIHYEVGGLTSDDGMLDRLKALYDFHDKNIIFNFFTQENGCIEAFNDIIGDNKLIKFNDDYDCINSLTNYLISKVIDVDNTINVKYICTKITLDISLLLNNALADTTENNNIYIFLLLNQYNEYIDSLGNQNKRNNITLSNFLSIAFNTGIILVSLVMVWNIIQEIRIQYSKSFTEKLSLIYNNESSKYQIKVLEADIDEKIILEMFYPRSIKYRSILVASANHLVLNDLLNSFRKAKNIPDVTAFLIYFIYIQNHINNDTTKDIVSVISQQANIPVDKLIRAIKYTDSATSQKLIDIAEKVVTYKYSNVSSWYVSNHFNSFVDFEKKYLGISNNSRVNNLYKGIEIGVDKCTTQNILSSLLESQSIPPQFDRIFDIYKKQTAPTRSMCSSKSMENLVSSLKMIEHYDSIYKQVKDFKQYLNNIYLVFNHLEKQSKSESVSKQYKSFMPSLVQYAVNSISYMVFDEHNLPLIVDYNKNMYMKFSMNFYSDSVSISPLYSLETINDSIIPLNKRFDKIKTLLDKEYDVDLNFITLVYKNSYYNYIENYISSFTNLLANINSQNVDIDSIANDKTCMFFLITMNSTSSPFSNLIDYYETNIYLDPKSVEIKAIQKINKYFEKDSKYLSSKKIEAYRNIFSNLKQEIITEGYVNTYNKIKNGYKPLVKVYSDLTKLKSSHNNNLYILLKRQLDIAVKAIEKIAINNSVSDINNNVESKYLYLDSSSQFNINNNNSLTNEELISYIGSTGTVYSQFTNKLKPLLKYNKVKKIWYNESFSTPLEERTLLEFNKLYALNSSLFNAKDGFPKELTLDITPIPSQNYSYIFGSLLIGKGFVNSLNVGYENSTPISYNWIAKETVSIVLKLDDGKIVQKTYSGSWALIQALKDAKYEGNDIYTWHLNYKGETYPLSFKIKSEYLDVTRV